MNCWLKSKCLPTEHISYLKGLISPNRSGLQEHDGHVADDELSDLLSSCTALRSVSPPATPLMDVVCDAAEARSPDISLQFLNTPAAEEGRLQSIYRESEMQDIFDSRPANDKANDSAEHASQASLTEECVSVLQHLKNIENSYNRIFEDTLLHNLMDQVKNRISDLK